MQRLFCLCAPSDNKQVLPWHTGKEHFYAVNSFPVQCFINPAPVTPCRDDVLALLQALGNHPVVLLTDHRNSTFLCKYPVQVSRIGGAVGKDIENMDNPYIRETVIYEGLYFPDGGIGQSCI